MEEEIDYMSDDFIKNCVDSAKDIRPGLLKSHRAVREHNLMKKKNLELENRKKPTDVLQSEILEQSLKQPISSSNKGFSMLEKMGFKSGMGLGKNNSGITEPIGLNIKKDKKGLGSKTVKKFIKKDESKINSISEGDFRALMSKKNRERECKTDFRRSQKICMELDMKCLRKEPSESWFWPEEAKESDQEDDEEEEEDLKLSDVDKLEILTKYLRETYYYCVWCKVQFNDEKDMEDCPGPTRDDH